MIPMALTVALSTLPKTRQPLGLALFGMTATLGPAIGPTVGGWLTDTYGWQWVFYINLIPGALMICSIIFAVRSTPMQLGQLRDGDWLGIGGMAVGLGSLIAMLEEGQRDDLLGFGGRIFRRSFRESVIACEFAHVSASLQLVIRCDHSRTKTKAEEELLVLKLRGRKCRIRRRSGRPSAQKSAFKPVDSDQFQIGTRTVLVQISKKVGARTRAP
jgi:hypothetical protein